MPDNQTAVMEPKMKEMLESTPSELFEWWIYERDQQTIPSRGDLIKGVVIWNDQGDIRIDIGGKFEGLINDRELSRMTRQERCSFEVGKELYVQVVKSEGADGNVIVSIEKAKQELDWQRVEKLHQDGEIFECQVTGFNKGGVLVDIGRIGGFVPGSKISRRADIQHDGNVPGGQWASMVGKSIKVKVIEIDRLRNRLILSQQDAVQELNEQERKELLKELREGQIMTGTVVSITNFGAFVRLGAADGLVHLSELSWKRVNHPSEVVSIGDQIQVYILDVDTERQRISLSMKRLDSDPWQELEEKCFVGDELEGVITSIKKFGAFARIEGFDGIEGLIHISELSEAHVENPREIVNVGDKVPLRVLKIDIERRRLGLALNQEVASESLHDSWDPLDSDDSFTS
jgi:small subunit ribosomal protein S1